MFEDHLGAGPFSRDALLRLAVRSLDLDTDQRAKAIHDAAEQRATAVGADDAALASVWDQVGLLMTRIDALCVDAVRELGD
jgi:hypothetical protein